MLPVAHHACTLATGALWSSCTMIVSPFGKINFCAELGGKATTDELPVAPGGTLPVLNIIATTSATHGANRIIQILVLTTPRTASRSPVLPARTVSQKPRQTQKHSG